MKRKSIGDEMLERKLETMKQHGINLLKNSGLSEEEMKEVVNKVANFAKEVRRLAKKYGEEAVHSIFYAELLKKE